ncbi:hypothetical protein GN956_G17127 [Arapaima gigas]
MEEGQASACKEDKDECVRNICADLRDDTYFRLLEDFTGAQSGENLLIDKKPCKNRLLVQVGLLKEDKQISWSRIVKWLQKIFPMYKSSDFRSLIERSVATATCLNGEAREAFLESDVNFEFVGPICDLLGIGRSDLLEMSDFSDRVKCTEVTNGIVLELSNFVAREKIDPVVLVSWLRNFKPKFCSDGKIQKAYKGLQKKLQRLKLDYRLHQRKGFSRKGMMDVFLQTEFNLVSNVFGVQNKRPCKQKQLSKKPRSRRAGLCKEENGGLIADANEIEDPLLNEVDSDKKAVFINSKEQKRMSNVTVKSQPPSVLHLFRTSGSSVKRDCDQSTKKCHEMGKPLVKGTIITPDAVKAEFLTLLDVSMLSLQKLWSVYGGKSHEANQVNRDLLQTQFTLMLKEDSIMKEFNDKINKIQTEPCSVIPPLHFIDCNAHFLLEVGDALEQQIICFEREIVTATGQRLGRDKNPMFSNFLNFSESAAARYICMACDVLNPPSETRHCCRRQWLNFCEMMQKPSKLALSHSNRFISYYECAASVAHHHEDILKFFSELNKLVDRPNIIQESVKDDANDQFIQALVCVIAIVYCKVLGPYWQLLKSNEEYLNFRRYVQCLHWKLLLWAEDASSLLVPEHSESNVFHQFPLQERSFDGIFSQCSPSPEKLYTVLIEKCLQKVMKAIADCTEAHLKDFLQGGIYNKDPSVELCLELQTCQLSHLMGEYPYGHAYTYQWKVRDDLDTAAASSSLQSAKDSPAARAQHKISLLAKCPVKLDHNSLSERNAVSSSSEKTERYKQGVFSEKSVSKENEQDRDTFKNKSEMSTFAGHGERGINKQDSDCLLMKLDGVSYGRAYPYQWKITDVSGDTPTSSFSQSNEASPVAQTQHKFSILDKSPVKMDPNSPSERSAGTSLPGRPERYKRGAFSEKSTSEEKEQEQDAFMKKSVVAAVARYGGPCTSKQDVDRLLMKLDGVSYAQKRDAIRCEINYQKMVLDNRDEKLDYVGFSLTDMVEKLKMALPDEKEAVLGRTYWEVEDGSKDGQACDLLVPVSTVPDNMDIPLGQSPGSKNCFNKNFNLEDANILHHTCTIDRELFSDGEVVSLSN